MRKFIIVCVALLAVSLTAADDFPLEVQAVLKWRQFFGPATITSNRFDVSKRQDVGYVLLLGQEQLGLRYIPKVSVCVYDPRISTNAIRLVAPVQHWYSSSNAVNNVIVAAEQPQSKEPWPPAVWSACFCTTNDQVLGFCIFPVTSLTSGIDAIWKNNRTKSLTATSEPAAAAASLSVQD